MTMSTPKRLRGHRRQAALAACLCAISCGALTPVAALAAAAGAAGAGPVPGAAASGGVAAPAAPAAPAPIASAAGAGGAKAPLARTVRLGALLASVRAPRVASLESAASKAGETGRKVAMSLIGLAFAIAAIVLAFRRDFKEAAGVFAVGLLAVLLATPAGVSLLRETVKTLVGA